jgi:penicillin-binding protein 1C
MKKRRNLILIGSFIGATLVCAWILNQQLDTAYKNTLSMQVVDRKGEIILLEKNNKGYLVLETKEVSGKIRSLLLLKEDRFFPYHLGVNPVSMSRAVMSQLGIGDRDGSSTITQQLAKLLLGTETERTVSNKLVEMLDSFVLELFNSKKDLLLMYANSVYMGNQIQGIETASRAYFNMQSDKLGPEQILQLLVTLNNPSRSNPLLEANIPRAKTLARQLGISINELSFAQPETVLKNLKAFSDQSQAFEIAPWLTEEIRGDKSVTLTIDIKLNNNIRSMMESIMPDLHSRDAHDAAVVVLDAHTNQILALIGSPDPTSLEYGHQINMLTKPRQVASTIKPLLYAKAFEAGMRPHTLIDDREYAYTTADGRILYPRNFDGKYHGLVRADYALANSINVPAIKILEFLGPEKFLQFAAGIGYAQPQKIIEHQLGTALGTIDMTLLELTHYYSIFPNEGSLLPLKLFADTATNQKFYPEPMAHIIDPQYAQFITKILSDRHLAIDQFGYSSSLSLPLESYALKTGTSDDYRDTWVIGYTPDFIVGTWVGNADNSPTKNLSGQTGAGEIWSRVMQLLADTEYNRGSAFSYSLLQKTPLRDKEVFSLPGDDVVKIERLLLDSK